MKNYLKSPREHELRKIVFVAPLLISFLVIILSSGASSQQSQFLLETENFFISSFGWLFHSGTFLMLVICCFFYFSKWGKIKIGGVKAKPILSFYQVFFISLCTTVAVGILFWAFVEPLYHFHEPPLKVGIKPQSPEALVFSLSTLYLHWTLTPYGIYTVAALGFALNHYNFKKPYSLSAPLSPLLGDNKRARKIGTLVDSCCLLSLLFGITTTLAIETLMITHMSDQYTDFLSSPFGLGVVIFSILSFCTLSSISGLKKGIRYLSQINILFFFLFIFAVFFATPLGFYLQTTGESLLHYLQNFMTRSVAPETLTGEVWSQKWTVFYLSSWLAWAPVASLFLGRLCYGYTVRQLIQINLLLPACFTFFWVSVLGGSCLFFDALNQYQIYDILKTQGTGAVPYYFLSLLPTKYILIPIFTLLCFVSYITAVDSNLEAMGRLCIKGDTKNPDADSPAWIKIILAFVMGCLCWVTLVNSGLDGVKVLCNLAGIPSLFLMLAISAALVFLAFKMRKNKDFFS